ncbi:MAG: hypothetical protein Q9191_008555, partial [Dirinaria sp. TL-2023a]
MRRHPALSAIGAVVFVLLVYHSFFSPPSLPSQPNLAPSQEIPPKIWQIYFGYSPLDSFTEALQSWISNNQDCAYTLMSDKGGDAFVQKHYAGRPGILQPFLDLRFPVLRSDFLRYLVLHSEGGVYSDLDTVSLKPFREWIAPELRSQVHAVVGIEYDQRDDEPYIGMSGTRLQFCQWTMAASPGHPILERVINSVVKALHGMARRHATSIHQLEPSDEEVME